MRRRLLNLLTALSLLLCAATLGLWVRSYWRFDLVWYTYNHLANYPEARRSNLSTEWGGFEFQTRPTGVDEGYEPPMGYITAVAHAAYSSNSSLYNGKSYVFGLFTWLVTEEGGFYTVFPIALPVLVFGILPARYAIRVYRRRRSRGLCPTCGYDLRATPGRCPECGGAASVTT